MVKNIGQKLNFKIIAITIKIKILQTYTYYMIFQYIQKLFQTPLSKHIYLNSKIYLLYNKTISANISPQFNLSTFSFPHKYIPPT